MSATVHVSGPLLDRWKATDPKYNRETPVALALVQCATAAMLAATLAHRWFRVARWLETSIVMTGFGITVFALVTVALAYRGQPTVLTRFVNSRAPVPLDIDVDACGWRGRIGGSPIDVPWSQITSMRDAGEAYVVFTGRGLRRRVVAFAKASVSDPGALWLLADREMTGTYHLVRRPDARLITNTRRACAA